MTLVTHVTGVSTFKDCDRKHSLLNRVEKLGVSLLQKMFIPRLDTCGKTRHTRHTVAGNATKLQSKVGAQFIARGVFSGYRCVKLFFIAIPEKKVRLLSFARARGWPFAQGLLPKTIDSILA